MKEKETIHAQKKKRESIDVNNEQRHDHDSENNKSCHDHLENQDDNHSGSKSLEREELAKLNEQFSKMQQKLTETEAELKKTKDLYLRASAEVQNTKRRAMQDVEKAHKYSLEKFVESLLPVVDSLERGLESSMEADNISAMKEGLALTRKLFLDTSNKQNVEQLSPEGEPFDPESHQAMSQIDNPEVESGSVVNVFQKGYKLNGRLIRPAMVIVAK